ncbi:50S ribosomal protein L25/general stress protein Ctc [Tenacibaculum maritimum]|uniref:50S ribosomal protein L25/general stress protein Ctc n=1 Tax=Tenacibaculum maritimum TaxID=107401 RepID=UPI0010A3B587|nr:50S ribosomal protein L25/general stress protein Ctc [Tenacibaculum maritimum]MCD9563810.1 50S ribosomal protein L25/general stress protein Ctc [Tenacibaculum maritimum]MCD9566812.1 50S ribosomal protein L25/general stress protein Ctc [Tenacibaculum maritimum]MCD9580138.1 50S ribosomal protein L25/general stress protein Ctc [Tenacibaculum maritimum]MCD9586035.1 50S ribosomal protein L25/general stress protein Ctc [Tenacibaculum maritimum]MCD9597661.1 50S ribosomal protein L25/general stress
MKSITINGSQRESVGKKATKALRNAGKVPCVLYGGDKPVHFSAEEIAFKNLVYTPNVYTASIEIGGTTYAAILQDIQFHPVTDKILHVDFYQLFENKEVTMNIPVRLVGVSKGVMIGGALRHNLRKLKVKALPSNLPDFIEADITELQIGNKLYVTELKNDNYTLLHPDNTVVAQVRMSRNAAKAATEAEA